MPMAGERTMKAVVFIIPDQTSVLVPALAMPAPISPPIKACDELLGNPKYHVVRFQTMAPLRAERITKLSTISI